jgi:alpha-beta hydrolase superfamily lysophospholipase
MKKWLRRLLYTICLLFVLLNILVAVQAYHATHFYDRTDTAMPKKRLTEMSGGEKLTAILFGVRVPKRLVVDSLAVPHQGITLLTDDGLRLSAWYAGRDTETNVPAKGTVIMFHGHGDCKSSDIKEAEAFYAMGYRLLMVDFRAHGESEGNTCTIGYKETGDVKAAYDYVTAKGEKNIVLWGVSLGASTIIKALHDYGLKPSKVILEMPFGSLFEAVKGFTRINHVPEEPAAVLLTFWGGIEQGFWAFNMKPTEYAKDIHCPVLLERGENDIRVTEHETQEIFHNIPSPTKTLVEYADCGHESLYKKDSTKWTATVCQFLSAQ